MTDDNRTLVLMALPMSATPVGPHRPGTFVVGYVNGEKDLANEYLNACKSEKINVLIQNAFLCQIGIEFEPELELDPNGNPVRGPDGKPVLTGNMGINQGFSMFPLTNMDATNGCDYGLEATYWIFPKGSMLQDFEQHFQVMSERLLNARTGMTTHPNLPPGMKPPQA